MQRPQPRLSKYSVQCLGRIYKHVTAAHTFSALGDTRGINEISGKLKLFRDEIKRREFRVYMYSYNNNRPRARVHVDYTRERLTISRWKVVKKKPAAFGLPLCDLIIFGKLLRIYTRVYNYRWFSKKLLSLSLMPCLRSFNIRITHTWYIKNAFSLIIKIVWQTEIIIKSKNRQRHLMYAHGIIF